MWGASLFPHWICELTFAHFFQAASHAGGFPGSDAMLLQQQQFVTMHESYCVMLESFVNLLRRVVRVPKMYHRT